MIHAGSHRWANLPHLPWAPIGSPVRTKIAVRFPKNSITIDVCEARFDQVADLLGKYDRVIVDLATNPTPLDSVKSWIDQIQQHALADRVVVLHNDFDLCAKSAVYLPVYMLLYSFYEPQPWQADRRWNWCSLNGSPKYHRLETARFIYEHFDDSECLLTCAFDNEHAAEYVDNTWIDADHAKGWLNLLPIKHPAIDSYKVSWANMDLDLACRESCVNCVTETTMYSGFVSEKTVKPLRAGQFFVLVAAAGTVAKLRAWGFDVFDDLFEGHAYDAIPDIRSRLRSLFDLVLRVRDRDWSATLQQCSDRLQQNQRRLASSEFRDHIMRDFRQWSDLEV